MRCGGEIRKERKNYKCYAVKLFIMPLIRFQCFCSMMAPRPQIFIFAMKNLNSSCILATIPNPPPWRGRPGCHIGDLASLARVGFISWWHDMACLHPARPTPLSLRRRQRQRFPPSSPTDLTFPKKKISRRLNSDKSQSPFNIFDNPKSFVNLIFVFGADSLQRGNK